MDGYLKRIVTRGTSLQDVEPFVRSASPAASEDQRIGMPGFDGFPTADPMPVPDDAATVPPAPRAPPIRARANQTSLLQRKVSLPAARDGGPFLPTVRSVSPVSSGLSAPGHAADAKPESVSREQLRGAAPPLQRSGSEVEPPRETSRRTPEQVPEAVQFEPPKPPKQAPLREQSSPAVENRPQLLEPLPRAAAPPSQRPTGFEEAESEQAPGRGPQVTIGRIHVEVVPPAAEPTATAPARPAPLTAASVSVIGKLSGRARASRAMSLRYR
jgi:hypothetical protein